MKKTLKIVIDVDTAIKLGEHQGILDAHTIAKMILEPSVLELTDMIVKRREKKEKP